MLLSLLRRIPGGLQLQIPVKIPYPPPPLLSSLSIPMDSSITSRRLSTLPGSEENEVSSEIEDRSGKVVSQIGLPESSTPIGRSKKAAVLVCLFQELDGHLRVILTKRSSNLSTHSGEVALPGGKMDEGDKDMVHTATREAKEEIGLDPSLVNVVTILEPFISKNSLRVFPVIGMLSNKEAFKPFPNADEVEAVFDAPLEMFLRHENQRVEVREWMGCKYLVHFFDYETPSGKYLIWGLTAGILIKAASVVYRTQPPFLVKNP